MFSLSTFLDAKNYIDYPFWDNLIEIKKTHSWCKTAKFAVGSKVDLFFLEHTCNDKKWEENY